MKKLLILLLLAAPMASMAQKFGHVNANEVMQAMPEFTKAQNELKALGEQYDADLKGMQEEIQKKAEALEKEQATLPANIKQRRETELQEMYQKYQQSAQDNQQALYKAQQEKMQAISGKIIEAIKQVGQSGGYVYIMNVDGSIPYISTTLSTDVTKEVKTKLGLK
ncbi:MAG: OmpH family outer membrane protein [Prevotella sp.]|nr:OmpH family outer membrane protein [Prevotella sp.]